MPTRPFTPREGMPQLKNSGKNSVRIPPLGEVPGHVRDYDFDIAHASAANILHLK